MERHRTKPTHLIEVTSEDIKQGIVGDPYACPIAHALRRQFGAAYNVSLRYAFSVFKSGGEPMELTLPPPAAMFIERFDNKAWWKFWARPRPFKFWAVER